MPAARNNPLLPDSAKAALPYWPEIAGSVAAGENTSQLWDRIRSRAADLGMERPGVGIVGVQQLRAAANQIERTARDVNAAADSKRMLSSFVSPAPWARPPGERKANPWYQVRFQHTVTGPEGESTEWRTVRFTGRLPSTVGRLRRQVEADAVELAREYQSVHVGIGNIQVLSI